MLTPQVRPERRGDLVNFINSLLSCKLGDAGPSPWNNIIETDIAAFIHERSRLGLVRTLAFG